MVLQVQGRVLGGAQLGKALKGKAKEKKGGAGGGVTGGLNGELTELEMKYAKMKQNELMREQVKAGS